MTIFFILGLLLGGVVVFFVFQNIGPVSVSFFAWQLDGSLSLVLLVAVLSGVALTLLFLLPRGIANYFAFRKLTQENKKLEDELKKQKELTVFAKTPPPTPEVIKKIEDGSAPISESEKSKLL